MSGMIHNAAFALMVVGGLRLMDMAWPTEWLPWPFYVGEVVVALVLLTFFP